VASNYTKFTVGPFKGNNKNKVGVAVCKGRITTDVSFSVKPKMRILAVIKIEFLQLAKYRIAFLKFAITKEVKFTRKKIMHISSKTRLSNTKPF
jgi:hypothetical protein